MGTYTSEQDVRAIIIKELKDRAVPITPGAVKESGEAEGEICYIRI